MNQKEQKARDKFRKESDSRIKVKLIENQSGSTSDSACINRLGTAFWLEFKCLDDWPKRASTLPLRDEFRPGQIPFLKEWRSWNGRGYVLLKAGDDWLLLNPKPEGGGELPQMTKEELERDATIASGLNEIINYLEHLE